MRLLSATEDLTIRTLDHIEGLIGKLLYLASLKNAEGRYSHWGLERVHGEQEAQQAASSSHAAVVKQILRKPLRELRQELNAAATGERDRDLIDDIRRKGLQLLPAGSSRATTAHFNSVLAALAEIDRAPKQGSNCPAA